MLATAGEWVLMRHPLLKAVDFDSAHQNPHLNKLVRLVDLWLRQAFTEACSSQLTASPLDNTQYSESIWQ